ncbi:MAG: glycosyltransferase family 4 protein [Bacteroidia bacterium]|nr:glycosyltransferase family 4 protein [Bacteroidia bacterium]MBT8278048.1 glycosyltransferase family 4 protein [Bacteroidia bacterium]MBT8393614.1 glycosyltransferase family 4 protein [Bacteroidia bacterium]NNF85790.1 glycosyltransferase family 4 protein [Winogradskyella sp.]NNL33632.1 glycosyltransferase family 4 protein [Flavobacteriaceae bacterium]
MRILFLTDNFPPEVNAPATRTFEHCREWVKNGAEVTVITCAPNFPFGKTYENYKNRIYQTEIIDAIKVIRVWSYMAPNKGFMLRTLDFISFSITSFLAGLFVKTDVVMATSPQFFTALSGRALSFFKRKPYVLEIRDLWPEQILVTTNMKRNWLIKYFEWEARKCYRRADLIVTVTNSYVEKITIKGINKDKFVVVKNGVDRNAFKPTKKNMHLIQKYDLHNKFIVGYIGTHGLSQNIPFIIDCIHEFNQNHQDSRIEVHFLFVGEGAEKEKVKQKSDLLDIFNITFIDQIKKEEMTDYLSLLDVSIVPLKKSELFLSVIPSKIFELSAMNIPILLGVDGEARALLEKYGNGIFYKPEDKESFLRQLTTLVSNDSKSLDQYKNGGNKLALDYDRQKMAMKLLDSIKNVVK